MHLVGCTLRINYSVFDMLRTTKCLSSGRLVHAVYGTFFPIHTHTEYQTHPDIDRTSYTDVRKNTIKLHVQFFLRMNTWLLEARQRQYN